LGYLPTFILGYICFILVIVSRFGIHEDLSFSVSNSKMAMK